MGDLKTERNVNNTFNYFMMRSEIRENSRIHLDRLQNKCTYSKGVKKTPILDKLLEYKRSWIQHVNRMPRNRLPRVMKY
jgi:hypothetical protein